MTSLNDSKRRSKRKSPPTFHRLRLSEINRTIPTRTVEQIRAVLPEVALIYRTMIVSRYRPAPTIEQRMEQWLIRMRLDRTFTPDEIAEAVEQAEQRKHLAPENRLAEILGLEYADRQRLAINTIGAIDKTKRERTIERKKRKREKDRIRAAIKRRARGAISREEWLSGNHLSRSRPWEREGISKATWYRRRETDWSPPHRSLPSDTPVSKGNVLPVSQAKRDAVLGLAAELGVIEERRSDGGVRGKHAA
jgi:hypothetical protein